MSVKDRSVSVPKLNILRSSRKLKRKETLTDLLCEASVDKMNYDDGLGDMYNVSFHKKLRLIEEQEEVYEDDMNFREIVTSLRKSIKA